MKSLCVLGAAIMLFAAPVFAYNEHGSLAIHLVASYEYLQCDDLCPPDMTCEDINCDLSLVELEASGGYGYAAFVAYNIEQVDNLEFYVVGWPLDSGAPDFSEPQYCPTGVLRLGEPFEARGGSGAFLSFPYCQEPCNGLFCFCTIAFGPDILDWLPIAVAYEPSRLTFPSDPFNFFIDCTVNWEITCVLHEHSAVIGGACDSIPNCEPGPTGNDGSTWGAVKELYR